MPCGCRQLSRGRGTAVKEVKAQAIGANVASSAKHNIVTVKLETMVETKKQRLVVWVGLVG